MFSVVLSLSVIPSVARAQQGGASSAATLLPDVVVTPGRTPQPLSQIGSAVTVVTRDEIAKTNPASLVDALRSVPGLDITESGGPGSTAMVRLRGANTGQTLVMIDGIRVNDPSDSSGNFDFVTLPPAAIERIEVLRGPQSALYGSDAIGGVINIITKSGKGIAGVQSNVRTEAGTYGTASTSGTVLGSQGPWSYAMTGLGQRSDGFSRYGYRIPSIEARGALDRDGYQRVGGQTRIGYDPGNGVHLEFGGLAALTRADFDGGFNSQDSPAVQERGLYNGYARGSLDTFDGLLTHSLLLFGNRNDREATSITTAGSPTATTSSISCNGVTITARGRICNMTNNYVGERTGAEYQGNLKLGPLGTLIVGGRFEQEAAHFYQEDISPISIPFRTLSAGRQSTQSAFTLWQLPIGERLNLSLGGRTDDVIGVDRFDTGRAALAYSIFETGTKLRASVGTGGKAPTLFQRLDPTLGNQSLQSEESFGWDAGFDQSVFDGRVSFSATYFQNRLKNLIVSPTSATLVSLPYVNIARAKTSGAEFAADVDLIPALLRLKAAYTNMTATDETTHFTLARRPRHTGQIAFVATPVANWTIEPRLFLVSERFNLSNNGGALAPYTRFDIYTAYKIDANWKVFARAENILDTYYQEVANFGTTGRAFYGGFDVTW